MGQTFYISDLHFGHKNILAFDNRQFPSIEAHDETLIEYWNDVVGMDDDVWILGDISLHPPMKTVEILQRLNGTKHLCVGNHDKKLLRNIDVRSQFCEIVDYKEIQTGKTGIVLCHYPIPCFNHHFQNWVHLYGHVHNSFEWNIMKQVQYEMTELYGKPCRMYNVGCMIDEIGYEPRTLDYILDSFERGGM